MFLRLRSSAAILKNSIGPPTENQVCRPAGYGAARHLCLPRPERCAGAENSIVISDFGIILLLPPDAAVALCGIPGAFAIVYCRQELSLQSSAGTTNPAQSITESLSTISFVPYNRCKTKNSNRTSFSKEKWECDLKNKLR